MVSKDSDIFLKSVNLIICGDVNLPCISWLTKIVINIFLEYSNQKLFNGDVNVPCKDCDIFLKYETLALVVM